MTIMKKPLLFLVILGVLIFSALALEPLFDVVVHIPQQYRSISAGEELLASVELVNVGSEGRVDVYLDYWISDSNNLLIFKKRETVAVETQANFVRTFQIPDDLSPGIYVLHAKMTYFDGKEAESSHSFEIIEKKNFKDAQGYVLPILTVIILLGLILLMGKTWWERIAIYFRVYRIILNRRKRNQ